MNGALQLIGPSSAQVAVSVGAALVRAEADIHASPDEEQWQVAGLGQSPSVQAAMP